MNAIAKRILILKDKTIEVKLGDRVFVHSKDMGTRAPIERHVTKVGSMWVTLDDGTRYHFDGRKENDAGWNHTLWSSLISWRISVEEDRSNRIFKTLVNDKKFKETQILSAVKELNLANDFLEEMGR